MSRNHCTFSFKHCKEEAVINSHYSHHFAVILQMFLKLSWKGTFLSFGNFLKIIFWEELFSLKSTATITKFIPPQVAGPVNYFITKPDSQQHNSGDSDKSLLLSTYLCSSNRTFYLVPSINHSLKSLNFAFTYSRTSFVANLLATAD